MIILSNLVDMSRVALKYSPFQALARLINLLKLPVSATIVTMAEQKDTAYSAALKFISKRMKTRQEVIDKLKKLDYGEESIDYAVNRLTEYGYIDDRQYVKSYLDVYSRTRGAKRLAFELKNKGIPSKLLEGIEDDREIALEVAKKFISRKNNDEKLKQKLYNHMLARGFSFGIIGSVWTEIGNCELELWK